MPAVCMIATRIAHDEHRALPQRLLRSAVVHPHAVRMVAAVRGTQISRRVGFQGRGHPRLYLLFSSPSCIPLSEHCHLQSPKPWLSSARPDSVLVDRWRVVHLSTFSAKPAVVTVQNLYSRGHEYNINIANPPIWNSSHSPGSHTCVSCGSMHTAFDMPPLGPKHP